jgi:hypothetical protein
MADYGKGTNGIDGPLSGPLSNPNNSPMLVGSYVNHLYYAVDGGVWSWDGSGWILHTSLKGDVGEQGPMGEQGPIGESGLGLKGFAGKMGNQGFQGTQGLRGLAGAAGVALSVPMLIIPRTSMIAGLNIDDNYITVDDNLSRYCIRGIEAAYGAELSEVAISYKLIKVSAKGIELELMRYHHLDNTKCISHVLTKYIDLDKGDSIYLTPVSLLDVQGSSAKGYSITLQLRQKS